ncbi:MAG: cbb3-type cytochrome c oxidase subunit I [Planctomycetaceae bacterium]
MRPSHVYQRDEPRFLGMTFATSTMMIALPVCIKVFNWIGTIWDGNIQFNAAELCGLRSACLLWVV